MPLYASDCSKASSSKGTAKLTFGTSLVRIISDKKTITTTGVYLPLMQNSVQCAAFLFRVSRALSPCSFRLPSSKQCHAPPVEMKSFLSASPARDWRVFVRKGSLFEPSRFSSKLLCSSQPIAK
ncbi:hypothetical protein AVEN_18081-1 [Araneus ventricosus]|uniref:Uncharacterized protein n=1 Tax=Araneus ventricosus TaxID=182803 RepID=A0A4Y2GN17_ARAVE|nr:hypothetical protein AVEN_18081-1 [Araneus ventricosus]